MADQRNCHDCGAEPGTPHGEGCDTARCVVTGMQRLVCGLRPQPDWKPGAVVLLEERDAHPGEDCGADSGADIWTGQWPGEADAIRLGWWCYFVPNGQPSWVQCGPDHPEARPDLNRLAIDGVWSREELRWEKR